MSEQVYVVRLTECELDELKEICSPEMNEATLCHARPEHPERQAALERLAKFTDDYDAAQPGTLESLEAMSGLRMTVKELRSLEGK